VDFFGTQCTNLHTSVSKVQNHPILVTDVCRIVYVLISVWGQSRSRVVLLWHGGVVLVSFKPYFDDQLVFDTVGLVIW